MLDPDDLGAEVSERVREAICRVLHLPVEALSAPIDA